jgi:hypothetical protein
MLKKFFENVNRQTAPLTLVLSAEWRGLMKGKEFKDTPNFCYLPQGERRDGRKKFNSPSPLPSPAKWRGKIKG